MADTLVKKPKLIVGTQSQVEAEMGDNDIGFATDIEFYNKAEIDEQYTSIITYVGDKDREIKSDITQLDTNIRTVGDWVNAKDESGNRATLTTEAQDAYRAINELNAKIGEGGGGASLPILMTMWSDHVINDMSWLRADTFSWQSGDVYKAAYEHLVGDLERAVPLYCWKGSNGTLYYSYIEDPGLGDSFTDGTKIIGSGTSGINISGDIVVRYSAGDTIVTQTDTIDDITITYYQADDGHKICTPDQESNLIALYEKTGAADYYLLDTTNKQFKLPRKQKRKLIQAVKNTDGTWYNLYSDGWVEQGGICPTLGYTVTFPVVMADVNYTALGTARGTTGNYAIRVQNITTTGMKLNSSSSDQHEIWWQVSGMAAESAYASAGMQLEYYYVGNFEQSAIEQTAGLNAELFNGKADVDLNNINPSNSAKATIISYGIPDYTSSTSISGNEFVAPCAGLVMFDVGATVQNGAGGSIRVNGVDVDYMSTTSCTVVTRKFAWVDEDDVVVFVNGAQGNSKIFFPLKGTK